jgi:hypothetical protein
VPQHAVSPPGAYGHVPALNDVKAAFRKDYEAEGRQLTFAIRVWRGPFCARFQDDRWLLQPEQSQFSAID